MNDRIVKRVLLPLGLAIVFAEPFLFWNAFAGDAQVHLTFMESAAQGRFFEFNHDEPVSGETSPGYMLLGALLLHLLPAAAVPIALKLIGLASWYLFCWLVWRAALTMLRPDDREGDGRVWAGVAAFIAATLAGSVYNANVGMENGLFAAAIWGWIILAAKWRWFEDSATSMPREISLSLWLGACGWLRPEAVIVAIVAFLVRGRAAQWRATSLLGLPLALLIGALPFAFERAFTGDLLPISVASRRLLAMPHTYALGPLALDPTFAVRLLVYLPLTALFFVAVRFDPDGKPTAGIRRFFHRLLAVFFVLYSLGGTPHLARYLIFLMPILAIGAAQGARWLWRRRTPAARALVVIAGLALAALGTVEPMRRLRLYPPDQLATAVAAPASRYAHTDELLRLLDAPRDRPLVVALESVQLRYELDDRVVVRSLDGRVDPVLFNFLGRGTVDHVGYLRARRVDRLLDTPSYNRAQSDWSLAALRQLQPGQVVAQGGVVFRRLARRNTFALSAP